MTPLRVIICGSKGRMGKVLIECVNADPELQLVGEIDLGNDLRRVIKKCDVIVDFSYGNATAAIASLAVQHQKSLVIGTTGHKKRELDNVRNDIKPIPCVWSSNYSTGVNTLFWLTGKVATIVGPKWDVGIVETHHTAKKDAPSGTAKTLEKAIEKANGKNVSALSMRIGDVVGDHTVTFGTTGERIELTHRASSRETFAKGALRAAKWVVHQQPGLYDMRDVLGLK